MARARVRYLRPLIAQKRFSVPANSRRGKNSGHRWDSVRGMHKSEIEINELTKGLGKLRNNSIRQNRSEKI